MRTFLAHLHFLVRVLGLTGLVVGGAGFFVWRNVHPEVDFSDWTTIEAAAGHWTAIVIIAGGGCALLAFIVELKGIVEMIASNRGAVGSSAALQIILAALLVAGANYYSYFNFISWDLTRDQVFTLDFAGDDDLREQLRRLDDETLIVLHRTHVSFGQSDGKRDTYDAAAERKVVSKIRDLIELFQDLGPRFKVVELDVQQQNYEEQLKEIKEDKKPLYDELQKSVENSVFFFAKGKVERLAFSDIYQLDKIAAADKKNLVLHFQGEAAFARRILNLGGKKPRIGVAVVHEVLGMQGDRDELSMPAARQVLHSHGFQIRDIVLKKGWEVGPPKPSALTHEETSYRVLQEEINEADAYIKLLKKQTKYLQEQVDYWRGTPLAKINKEWALVETVFGSLREVPLAEIREREKKLKRKFRTYEIKENVRQQILKIRYEDPLKGREFLLEQELKERKERVDKQKSLNVDYLAELGRISDVRAKLKRLLADVDLLIVPRATIFSLPKGDLIPAELHHLEMSQIAVIKEFLKSGKPVLFCLGPPTGEPRTRLPSAGNHIEKMLKELGFVLPDQAIIFDVEAKSFAQRRGNLLVGGDTVKPPPMNFDWTSGAGQNVIVLDPKKSNWRHPIHASVRLAAHSAGQSDKLHLRLRHPRPIYFQPDKNSNSWNEQFVFLMSGPNSWNEAKPFPDEVKGYTPRFDPGQSAAPDKGSGMTKNEKLSPIEVERRGPFPVGVAVETTIPMSWWSEEQQKKILPQVIPSAVGLSAAPQGQGLLPGISALHPTDSVRLAVIGHGGAFIGDKLSPVQKKLMLDVNNWLLGRDDLLASESETPWQYPRIVLNDMEKDFWFWGTLAGMPIFVVWWGCIVMLKRYLR